MSQILKHNCAKASVRLLALVLLLFSVQILVATQSVKAAETSRSRVVRLVYQQEYDQARAELAKLNPPQYEQLYVEGLIAKRQNHLADAEDFFRRALSEGPDFVPAKRELAHTLYLMGNSEGAKHHFQELADTAGNDVERDNYDQFLRAIKSKRPYGITGYFGILPSTNANKGSGKEYYETDFGRFKINDDSKAKSGVGVMVGGSLFYRHSLTEKSDLLFTGDLNSRLFQDSDLNSHYASASMEFGRQIGEGVYYAGLTSQFQSRDWNRDPPSRSFGLSFRGTQKLDPTRSLSFRLLGLRNYDNDREVREGYQYSASFDVRTQLSPASRFSYGGQIVRETTQREHLDHTDYSGRLSYTRAWKGGLQTDIGLSYERRNYDGSFPGLGEGRKDNQYRASLSLLHPSFRILGMAPKLTYTYTRNESNVSFYDYDASDVGLIFTHQF